MKGTEGPGEARSGLLLLNKLPGITSFEALAPVKRAFAPAKAGHTGTLDKFARGLLPVLVGRGVKLSPWFSGCTKEYEGKIQFGLETDTLDPEGQVTAQAPLPSREAVEAALPGFTGDILQAPPVYSAIHVDGKRAYALAREGAAVEMKKRPVTVYRLELRSWEPPFAEIFVRCSSGTYIRSLARDLALAAGSRAFLSALVRTRVAGFSLSEAVDPAAITASALRPLDRALIRTLGLPYFELGPEYVEHIIHGKPVSPVLDRLQPQFTPVLPVDDAGEPEAAALFCAGRFMGIAVKKDAGNWAYGYVYN